MNKEINSPELKNKQTPEQNAIKWRQIRRRIGLCMREIILLLK
jgi:hypothetical protein